MHKTVNMHGWYMRPLVFDGSWKVAQEAIGEVSTCVCVCVWLLGVARLQWNPFPWTDLISWGIGTGECLSLSLLSLPLSPSLPPPTLVSLPPSPRSGLGPTKEGEPQFVVVHCTGYIKSWPPAGVYWSRRGGRAPAGAWASLGKLSMSVALQGCRCPMRRPTATREAASAWWLLDGCRYRMTERGGGGGGDLWPIRSSHFSMRFWLQMRGRDVNIVIGGWLRITAIGGCVAQICV